MGELKKYTNNTLVAALFRIIFYLFLSFTFIFLRALVARNPGRNGYTDYSISRFFTQRCVHDDTIDIFSNMNSICLSTI